jgi:hypothetical protein
MAKKSAAPNPFASAAPKVAKSAAKAQGEFIPAQDIQTYDGGVYKQAELVEAIEGFVTGSEQYKQGDAMMKANRPPILALARTEFAKRWAMRGNRPDNPLVTTQPNGQGTRLKVVFTDSVCKLDENRYTELANLIGASAAEELTVKRDDFIINPELLDQTVKVKRDGKVVDQNVMEAIAEALQDRFGPSPDILTNLFQVVHKFETVKGLIDKGPQLLLPDKSAASIANLAKFLEVGHFVTQLRPSGGGD